MNEIKIGGLVLTTGAVVVLITIFIEYQLGWIGVQRPAADVPNFMFTEWEMLSTIWAWQALGYAFFTVSYLLLLKQSQGFSSLIWALLLLFGIMQVIAMCMTLGSYYPSLSVYKDQPELFNTIRGAIGTLYKAGKFGSLLLLGVFLVEVFKKEGLIPKPVGLTLLALVVGTILIGSLIGVGVKVAGSSWFLLPMYLGYSYWKNS